MTLDLWLSISAALLGLVMGSAVTALAHRVPRGISWVRGRSACPACGATLAARDLVPVLSWALAGGRCRHCGAGVPLRYPLTELWCAAWALLLGRGERLTPLALERPFRCVIAVPEWRVPTAFAFRQIDRGKYGLTRWQGKLKVAREIGRRRVNPLRALRLGNTFEEVLGGRRRDFEHLCTRLRDAGAVAVRMTGSGSAVFGILEPGTSCGGFAGRFAGIEPLFAARSMRAGLRVRKSP